MAVAAVVCWRPSWAHAVLRAGYRGMCPILLWITGVTVHQEGRFPAALDAGGYVLISNHSSNLDVLCLERVTGYQGLSVVIKSEVARLPLLGWYLRGLGWLGVERGQRGAGEQLIHHLEAPRAAGRRPRILIFPEGTRTRDGALQRFRLGPFLMAVRLQLPVAPVIIQGARLCHPRGALGFRAGAVSVRLIEPLTPPPLPRDDDETVRLAKELQQRAHALYQGVDLDVVTTTGS